jgi:hypothetical protein
MKKVLSGVATAAACVAVAPATASARTHNCRVSNGSVTVSWHTECQWAQKMMTSFNVAVLREGCTPFDQSVCRISNPLIGASIMTCRVRDNPIKCSQGDPLPQWIEFNWTPEQ